MPVSRKDGNAPVRNMNEQQNEENIPPSSPPVRLDRSPHPYHRRQLSPPGSITRSGKPLASHRRQTTIISPYEERNYRERLADASNQKPSMPVTSSDSGTEADDESGGVLRGLPAPPIKRKYSSPLLMPRHTDDERQKLCLEHQPKHEGSQSVPCLGDEEDKKIRNKYTRRRRTEYLRRLVEIILLGGVGFIACRKRHEAFLHSLSRVELAGYCGVVCGVYLGYLLELLYRHNTSSRHIGLNSQIPRIPAFFDPAPLLYPILLPVFVALSLAPFNPKILLANLILSIAAIPSQIIPFHRSSSGFNVVHWIYAAFPLLVARQGASNLALSSSNGDPYILNQFQADHFLLLFPLHQALVPALGYLTTTSLLPAELQLLSISMINLLFFSTSAQAAILKALLWIGGFLMFIFCDNVFQWGVALARVPSWRFRHSYRSSRGGNTLLVAVNDYFHGRLSDWKFISAIDESSDSDGGIFSGSEMPQQPRLERFRLKGRSTKDTLQDSDRKQPILDSEQKQMDFNESRKLSGPSTTQTKIPRRHTLLSYVGSPRVALLLQRTSMLPVSRPSPFTSRALLALTYAQATVVKWCYAAYVYLTALLIIVFPVRIAVSRWALRGDEPVGWALGYLFGDIPLFRFLTLDLHLERWIPLPPSIDSEQSSGNSDILHRLGAANIRLFICLYCFIILLVGLCIVFSLTPFVAVDTRRKVFHGMMVFMFLPSILIDPAFASLALSLALAIFLLLDLFRASQLPPLSKPLTYFLAPYVDGRDHRGPVIVSHIFLLIGCAIPLWLSLAVAERTDRLPWNGWEIPTRDVSMVSGVICVGMGDAAASLFGRRFGRRRWIWGGGKSLEGSLAFAVAVVLGLSIAKLGIRLGGWEFEPYSNDDSEWMTMTMDTLQKSTVAAFGASLTEAVLTGGNDNVIVPVVLWLLVRGLEI